MQRGCLVVILLAGCQTSTPAPRPPGLAFELPAAWGTSTATAASAGRWWENLGDPSLTALVAEALAHNHDLRAAVARLDAAAAQAKIAGAPLLPGLDSSFDAARQRQVFVGFPFGGGGVPSRTFNSFGVDVSSSWEIDLWGRVRAQASAGLADQEAAVAQVASAHQSLAAQTAKAYWALVEAKLQQALAARTVALYSVTATAARGRFERGVRAALDVRLAESNLAAAQALLAQRQELEQRVVRQLELLVGRYPKAALTTAADLPPLPAPPPAGLPAELLRRRPDVVAAERATAAQSQRVASACAALYPRLALTARAGTASQELQDLLDPDFFIWSLAANLTQPIFAGGQRRAAVALAQARERELLASYASTALRALAEVETALRVEGLLAERAQSLHVAAEHAQAAQSQAQERYDRGIESVLTVLEAQRRALDAESQALTARRLRWDARVELHLALGGDFALPDEHPDEPSQP